MQPVAISNAGMITGVGFNAPANFAAIRCGLNQFVETDFRFDNEWLVGSPVQFEAGWRGQELLLRMGTMVIHEALQGLEAVSTNDIPLLICLAETDRPGRTLIMEQNILRDLQQLSGFDFHQDSTVIANGRVSGVQAIDMARRLLEIGHPACLVMGIDNYLVGKTLTDYHQAGRLKTERNSDGFIPGQAAAAVVLQPADRGRGLLVKGIGYGREPSTIINAAVPLRADGLTAACCGALAQAGMDLGQLDYRLADLNGEHYGFREATLMLSRILRKHKQAFDIRHPAESVGEVGAAIVPIVCAVALASALKNYAPGPGVLCHFANDDFQRAAIVLQYLK